MTTFFLVRHAEKDSRDELITGRLPGIGLTARGRAQAEWLARRLGPERIDAICSSPLERAQATAAPLARLKGLPVHLSPGLQEIEFGEWTGRSHAELAGVAAWREFNTRRSTAHIPGGETYLDVQSRMVGEMLRLRAAVPNGGVVLVSHGDPLRAAIAYFAGAPPDPFDRFEIEPGSLSIVTIDEHRAQILRLNECGAANKTPSPESAG